MVRIRLCRGRAAKALSHNDERRHNLPRNSSNGSTGDPHFRKAEKAEDQKRVENDVRDRAEDLGDHWRFHIADRLQHLCPDALEEQPEAEYAYDPAIYRYIAYHRVRRGGYSRIGGHDRPADRSEQKPQRGGERCSHTGILIRLFRLAHAELCRHHRIDPHARSDGESDHQKLDRIDDGQSRQAGFRIPAHKQTVHDIIKRLNELREHHRRRETQQNFADFFRSEQFAVFHFGTPRFSRLISRVFRG